MNAERMLIASECIGDGHWFVEKAKAYASERVVFGRPIGANQGVQFPIAQAHAQIEAADLIDRKSTRLNSSHQIISYAVFCLKKKELTVHDLHNLSCEPDIGNTSVRR